MKILLCEDIDKLGYLGDIVDVSDGYARNFLLPENKAVIPSESNIKALAEAKARRAEQRKLTQEKLKRVAEEVAGAEVVLAAKANEQGHLFGSVAEHDIADNLRKQGYEVSDDMVQLAEHIKQVGTREITLKITSDLTVGINVVVVSEDQAIGTLSEDNEK